MHLGFFLDMPCIIQRSGRHWFDVHQPRHQQRCTKDHSGMSFGRGRLS